MRTYLYYDNETIEDAAIVSGTAEQIELSNYIFLNNFQRFYDFIISQPTVNYSNSLSGSSFSISIPSGTISYFSNRIRVTSGTSHSLAYTSGTRTDTYWLSPTTGNASGSVRVLDSSTGTIYRIQTVNISKYDSYYLSGSTGSVSVPAGSVKLCNVVWNGSSYSLTNKLWDNFVPIYTSGKAFFEANGIWQTVTGSLNSSISTMSGNLNSLNTSTHQLLSGRIDYVSGQYNTINNSMSGYFGRTFIASSNKPATGITTGESVSYELTIGTGVSNDLQIATGVTGDVLAFWTMKCAANFDSASGDISLLKFIKLNVTGQYDSNNSGYTSFYVPGVTSYGFFHTIVAATGSTIVRIPFNLSFTKTFNYSTPIDTFKIKMIIKNDSNVDYFIIPEDIYLNLMLVAK